MFKKYAFTSVVSVAASLTILFSFCVDQKKVKLEFVKAPKKWFSEKLIHLNKLKDFDQALVYEESIVILKNETSLLPLGNLKPHISVLSIGGESEYFREGIELFANIPCIQVPASSLINDAQLDSFKSSDIFIISMHATDKDKIKDSISSNILQKVPKSCKKILILFGSDDYVNSINCDEFDAVVLGHENHQIAQNRIAQLLFGAIGTKGKTQLKLNHFPKDSGIEIKPNGRLKFTTPEEVGLDPIKLKKIDEIALNGIKAGAYPGCQIVVAVEDKIIFRKSYGSHTYEIKKELVKDQDLFDIASITKIAASTLLAMHLNWQNKFDLSKSLRDYIPEVTGKTNYGSIVIKDMMAHQSGLTPFIAFYKKTIMNGQLIPEIYSNVDKEGFDLRVAEGIYMKKSYVDSLYKQILATPLGAKKYEYSDLCYYFTQKILEKQAGKRQDLYLLENIYKPMGLRSTRYLPLNFFDKSFIVPTERDMVFRKQLLHGSVHDPGAAMLGGVAGHAGLFSNATDLASIMQLFLNKGSYAGMQFFDAKTTEEFTKQQFPGNKRGAGFDRPNASGGGTCDKLASQQSFGHSGFTGTLAWADPKDKVIFVFLSNRVHPDQDNWKLRDMGIRTEIQHVVYEAVNSRKK
jgi:CubicO group peptidase (beta-lactamase class C family)